MTATALRTRNSDGRNFYQAPCCDVNIGVLEEAVRAECPACGATLCQLAETISVWTRPAETGEEGDGDPAIHDGEWPNCD